MAIYLSPPSFKPTHFSFPCTKTSVISSCSFRASKRSHPVLSTKLLGSRTSRFHTLKRSCSANSDDFSDDDMSEQIEELSKRLDDFSDEDRAAAEMSWNGKSKGASSFPEPPVPVAGVLEYCSVKKAFLSMVFMIRELQSYALHIREHLTCEDLQVIMAKVQREMNASFVWLFQKVFSQTPTLMVYVMILMANFTVHSMTHNAVSAAQYGAVTATATLTESEEQERITQNGAVSPSELSLWHSIVEEALAMQAEFGGFSVDHETMKRFVSPLTVEIEKDDYEKYFRTDLMYQIGISQEPNNPLLLANYAQFLYLVAHDHDRAEECFKRAVSSEPPDAEALGRYADFLWLVKKDLWEAEERYQQAMEIDPHNSHHSSKYANFLWSTGGVDTCFPLQSTDM